MIFDEYRILNPELYSSELIETSFCTFRNVLVSKVFYAYILLLEKTKLKSKDYKHKFIQLNKILS